jgi:hypothetical protein
MTKTEHSLPKLFVHVGKAGGSSIMLLVEKSKAKCKDLIEKDGLNANKEDVKNFEYSLLTTVKQQTCALSKIQKQRVHLKDGQHLYNNYTQFIINVRDPVDRLISWYNYELQSFDKEPRWQQGGQASENFVNLRDCYPGGIDDIIRGSLLGTERSTHPTLTNYQCSKLAKQCLKGDVMCFGHNYYNYEVYGEDLLLWKGVDRYNLQEQKDIRVDIIRSEHSMDDFTRIMHLWTDSMSAVGEFVKGLYGRVRSIESYNKGLKKQYKIVKEIPRTSASALCQHICTELVTYKYLLRVSDNLFLHEVRDSYKDLDDKCGFIVDEVCGTQWTYRNIKQQKRVFDMPW